VSINANIDVVTVLMTVVGFLIVYVLNGIKSEIRDTKTAVQNLETDLRGGMASLDRRMTMVEMRCSHTKEGESAC
jgi:hypothetical protein